MVSVPNISFFSAQGGLLVSVDKFRIIDEKFKKSKKVSKVARTEIKLPKRKKKKPRYKPYYKI